MGWPWRREARPIEPMRPVSTRILELETAREMLEELFGAWPGEVGERIQRRLEEWKGVGRRSA